MSEKRVYSVTIGSKNDCVVMTEGEAMLLKMKYEGCIDTFEMYDMTKRHGMKPKYLHKLQREQDSSDLDGLMRSCGLDKTQHFGGANAKVLWEFDDLINA